MFETIFIGTSGLLNHAKGLRVVGNNLANVNTPGFKSSQMQFSNLFEQGGGSLSHSGHAQGDGNGTGVTSLGTNISFRAGLDQGTGNPLHVNINGNGFYAITRGGETLYTRSGDFRFDADGILVNSAGDHVQGLDANGKLGDISVESFQRSMPKATGSVTFRGNISSATGVNTSLADVTVIDPTGADHPLSLSFVRGGPGEFTVTVTNAAGAVTTGKIKFSGGFPVAGAESLTFDYAPDGGAPFAVKLDFSQGVTSLVGASGLSVVKQDGYAAGVATDQTIEADGTLKFQYSNGQTATGPRIALANFKSDQALEEAGGGAFKRRAGEQVHLGHAASADFGTLVAGHLEGSNVDLAEEFGNLILMQRGYQASSHVISTANEMIQVLFDMKGR